jgi:UDP-N-acetylmuramoyl-L-alanyl-D-glutamate--2,6-diaminopimelate ligase
LKQVLTRANIEKEKNKKIILVFGTAGKRDTSKRPLMGSIAEKFADKIILTAEDPRGENVLKICKEIMRNVNDKSKFEIITEREAAIKQAMKLAKEGDMVLITGKGHEKSMNLDGIHEIPWSDQKIVKNALQEIK